MRTNEFSGSWPFKLTCGAFGARFWMQRYPPSPMGDEGIYTKVPNPEAGHEKEVIPPPDSPGGKP